MMKKTGLFLLAVVAALLGLAGLWSLAFFGPFVDRWIEAWYTREGLMQPDAWGRRMTDVPADLVVFGTWLLLSAGLLIVAGISATNACSENKSE